MALTIWHNPNCSTCRKTLARIIDAGVEPEEILMPYANE